MSSPGSDDLKTVAGHPPAVKAGGMRVQRTRKASDSKEAGDTGASNDSVQPLTPPSQNLGIQMSPASPPKEQVVIQRQDKPIPTHDMRSNVRPNMHIHQPRKQ